MTKLPVFGKKNVLTPPLSFNDDASWLVWETEAILAARDTNEAYKAACDRVEVAHMVGDLDVNERNSYLSYLEGVYESVGIVAA